MPESLPPFRREEAQSLLTQHQVISEKLHQELRQNKGIESVEKELKDDISRGAEYGAGFIDVLYVPKNDTRQMWTMISNKKSFIRDAKKYRDDMITKWKIEIPDKEVKVIP